ncbi:hypothetical protein BJ994_000128 [Arthrobacter pigmenti]|uniref:Uncharacterized protein n=1 Tax=Arthrobacter pigmenti TaxID=271432 RepID=A0A846RK67_9MICC|nr:hypothetical protein [Arthrobacter pigmenti]NJC21052.1 hypothetical protein [Arthrobacter pigmenti]
MPQLKCHPPARRRFNPHFVAAWSLTSIILILGVLWLFGYERGISPPAYANQVSIDPTTGLIEPVSSDPFMNIMLNLNDVGPLLLVAGLATTVLLLAMHGALRSRAAKPTT